MSTAQLRYDFVIDERVGNNTHNMTLAAVGRGKRVLDVGCATGYFSQFLADQQDCEVHGLEPDPVAAAAARERLGDRITTGGTELLPSLPAGSFDVVVFADVLEHLMDPAQALKDARRLLTRGGRVVASIPNVAHGDLRLMLLAGHFPYQRTGLLDSTHVRFLTRHTIPGLFERSGYRLTAMDAKTIPLGGSELGVNLRYFTKDVVSSVRADPHHEDYQYVVSAQPVATAARFAADVAWAEHGLVRTWATAFGPAERASLALPVIGDDASVAAAVAAVEQQCADAGVDVDDAPDIELVRCDGPLALDGWDQADSSWTTADFRARALPVADALVP